MKKNIFHIFHFILFSSLLLSCSNKAEQPIELGPSFKKHTNVEFKMNDEIFDQSLKERSEIVYPDGKLNTDLFVDETQNTSHHLFKEIKMPDTFTYPFYAIDADDFIIVFDETEYNKKHDVFLWNPLTDEVKYLDLKTPEDYLIIEVAFGSEYLYWIESDQDFSELNPAWKLKSYNIITEEIHEVDSSENYERISLIPTINNANDILIYLVGEEDSGEYNHYIFMYDGQNKKKTNIFVIENVIQAHVIPFINSKVIAFPEYFEEGWFLLVYDIEKESVTREPLSFLTDGEFPRSFYMTNEHIIYGSSQQMLYALNTETNELNIVSNGINNGAINGDDFYYTIIGDLWRYSTKTNTKELIYNSSEHLINSFHINNNILSVASSDLSIGKLSYLEFDLSN